MNKLKTLGIMVFTILCLSCHEEPMEQTIQDENINLENFDLRFLFENADSISLGTYAVVENLSTSDTLIKTNDEIRRTIVTGEEYWVGDKCYFIEGPYATSHMVTHPSINSPIPGNGFCGIIVNVYYNYSKVYEVINGTSYAVYYTCVKTIERITTQLYNASDYYLLWQDGGTRAYCPSSNYDPVLYPQEWIYVDIKGRIVGERGFENPYVDTDIEVNWTTSFRIQS